MFVNNNRVILSMDDFSQGFQKVALGDWGRACMPSLPKAR